jgi:hypothetical protein
MMYRGTSKSAMKIKMFSSVFITINNAREERMLG